MGAQLTDGTTASDMWARHSAQWRDTSQICSQWREAANLDRRTLEYRATAGWWETLARLGITLLITREYEHLAVAATVVADRPRLSYFPVPHPSGIAVDRSRSRVFLASTRNPNQVFEFRPVRDLMERSDLKTGIPAPNVLVPVASTSFPGSMYMHDLAVIGSRLHANAVGHNAVVRLGAGGAFERVWWPKCVDRGGKPESGCNYIQLNSIAAGDRLSRSFFTASSASMGRRRPGHLDYPVDGSGVIFSGRTREPICRGLTRPHSARFGKTHLWVANSGYGELGVVDAGKFEPVARLAGWTRGLSIVGDVAFIATSRVIPRYARYAPGLDVSASACAVHAVSCKTGKTLGRLSWPQGNQVFAVDWIPEAESSGFLFDGRVRSRQLTAFYYTYLTN